MAAILIREIEGGTDSNNRKITVISIRTHSRLTWYSMPTARGRPGRKRGGATERTRARAYNKYKYIRTRTYYSCRRIV